MSLSDLVVYGLGVIAKVTAAIIEANSGKLTPDEALARIAEATAQDRAVDSKVDEAIKAKFPTE